MPIYRRQVYTQHELQELSDARAALLPPSLRHRFNEAQELGYLVARDNLRDRRLRGAWDLYADAYRVPDCKVQPRTRWATVSLDLMPTGKVIPPAGIRAVRSWFPRPWNIGQFTYSKRVPIEHMRDVASSLLRVVVPLLEQPPEVVRGRRAR